jgi:type IV pilus assembly protein PilW
MNRGFALVELMVALTLGLLLLLGLATIFSSMNQSYVVRQNLSSVQDNQRMAMLFVSTSIRSAGFYPNPASTNPATQFPAVGSFAAGQTLVGAGGNAGADTFGTRFTASGGTAIQGCSASLVANDVYTDAFSVSGGYLTCTETDNTAGTPAVTVNLIAGLSGMNVLYGVDVSGSGSVTEYLTGDQVTAGSYWGNVLTAQVTLLFINPLANQPGQPTTVSLTQTVPYMEAL